jgi:xanthine dehydrogenase accessory factor
LIRVIADLPIDVTWVDSRVQLLPVDLPENIRALHVAEPVSVVAKAPMNACHLVMTHDHALDYTLCRAILERREFAWLGLIGSNSKGAKFRSRLAREGFASATIARLVSPIGAGAVGSKWPAAIAIAVAAQLLQVFESVADAAQTDPAQAVAVEPDSLCSASDCAQCPSVGGHRG